MLRVGMGESKNMANNISKVIHKRRLVMNPRGFVCSKKAVQTFDSHPKIHKHAQGIVHDEISRGHTAVFDTRAQKSMIVRYGW